MPYVRSGGCSSSAWARERGPTSANGWCLPILSSLLYPSPHYISARDALRQRLLFLQHATVAAAAPAASFFGAPSPATGPPPPPTRRSHLHLSAATETAVYNQLEGWSPPPVAHCVDLATKEQLENPVAPFKTERCCMEDTPKVVGGL